MPSLRPTFECSPFLLAFLSESFFGPHSVSKPLPWRQQRYSTQCHDWLSSLPWLPDQIWATCMHCVWYKYNSTWIHPFWNQKNMEGQVLLWHHPIKDTPTIFRMLSKHYVNIRYILPLLIFNEKIWNGMASTFPFMSFKLIFLFLYSFPEMSHMKLNPQLISFGSLANAEAYRLTTLGSTSFGIAWSLDVSGWQAGYIACIIFWYTYGLFIWKYFRTLILGVRYDWKRWYIYG